MTPTLCFVGARRGNVFMNELLAAVAPTDAEQLGFTVVGFVRPGDRRNVGDFEPWCAQVADGFDAVDLGAL